MATRQHYFWASGHFLLLFSSLRCWLSFLTFYPVSSYWYKASYTGALLSYSIVCFKQMGYPQPTASYIKRALLDENVQYLLLSVFWGTSSIVILSLLPYMIFSLFHALTFSRTTLMPQILGNGPPATSGGPPQPHPLAKRLQTWIKANYDTAMRVVAYTELVILLRVLLGTIIFWNSLMAPIIYVHFLRQRYFQSLFTREAVGTATKYVDDNVEKPGYPPMVRTVWGTAKHYVQRWAGVALQNPGAAGAERPGGR